MSRPVAQTPADLDAGDIGQHQVDDRGMRAADRRQVERLFAGLAGQHLVAGFAQHQPQRAKDLAIVVADEDALAAHEGSAAPASASGSSASTPRRRTRRQVDDEARPLAGQRLDANLAAAGVDEPLGDREPETRPLM